MWSFARNVEAVDCHTDLVARLLQGQYVTLKNWTYQMAAPYRSLQNQPDSHRLAPIWGSLINDEIVASGRTHQEGSFLSEALQRFFIRSYVSRLIPSLATAYTLTRMEHSMNFNANGKCIKSVNLKALYFIYESRVTEVISLKFYKHHDYYIVPKNHLKNTI